MICSPHYDLGVVCGRFAHAHVGHKSLFDTSLSLCKRTCILVGSAQERGTLRNPYSVETRIKVIQEMYPGIPESNLTIVGLNDMTNELDINADWGRYFKQHVESKMHKFASLMIYGNDEFRSNWFAPEDLTNTAEFIISRSTLPISGTDMRGFLVCDDEESWQKYTDPLVHGMYAELRDELMSVDVYKEIYDQIRRYKGMDLDAFTIVYSKYEAADKEKKLEAIRKLKNN